MVMLYSHLNENDQKLIETHLLIVFQLMPDCDDWVEIKKAVLQMLPSRLRAVFSKRHPKTKEQQTNQFEVDLINYYKL